jgi:hypothetical protein
LRNNGDLYFNPDAPNNHKQETFLEGDDEELPSGKAAAVKD